jgi:hypothetical protein
MRKLTLLPLLPVMLTACAQPLLTPSELFDTKIVPAAAPGQGASLVRMRGFTPLASSTRYYITGIGLSDDYLILVVDKQGVYRMPKYGGAVEPLDTDADASFRFVLSDGKRVFWDHENVATVGNDITERVFSRDLTSGAANVLVSQTHLTLIDQYEPMRYQLDGKYIYSGDDINDSLSTSRIWRQPIAGGAPQLFLDGDAGPYRGFLADHGDVFTITHFGNELDVARAGSTTLTKLADLPPGIPIIGGGVTLVTLACVDANNVYVSDGKNIFAVPRAGGAMKTLDAGGVTTPPWSTLVVDAENIYFDAGFAIKAQPLAGGPARQLSTDESQLKGGVGQVIQDDKNIFVIHLSGEVLMYPKSPASVQ